MASGSFQARARRIPKAAEQKVKINAPEMIEPSPKPEPKAFADASFQSWYTPAPLQSPTTTALQRPASNATPRTTPFKVNVGRTNSTKKFRSHDRTDSEVRRDGVEPVRRRVQKDSITHPDCPWIESSNSLATHRGHLAQPRPARSATRGSCESDKTAVEDIAPTRGDVNKEREVAPLAKSAQETLRPTVKLVSKPLPGPPVFDSVSSRLSVSTGSVYSDGDSFSYDLMLNLFPDPPNGLPDVGRFNDWESHNSLSTPPAFPSPLLPVQRRSRALSYTGPPQSTICVGYTVPNEPCTLNRKTLATLNTPPPNASVINKSKIKGSTTEPPAPRRRFITQPISPGVETGYPLTTFYHRLQTSYAI